MPRLARGGGLRSASWLWAMWVLAFALFCGCSSPALEPVRATWVVGQAMPSFDPQGPPDPVRWSIERLLSRGLVEEDSTGRVVLAAAESVEVSTDGRTYTFRLRGDLKFPGGRACGSQAFRRSLEAGLNRLDHATYGWLPAPALGIATPVDRTLVLRLSRPDSLLLRKLAFPGVAVPWDDPGDGGASGWRDGIGAYGIASVTPGGITLGKRQSGPGPDTLAI